MQKRKSLKSYLAIFLVLAILPQTSYSSSGNAEKESPPPKTLSEIQFLNDLYGSCKKTLKTCEDVHLDRDNLEKYKTEENEYLKGALKDERGKAKMPSITGVPAIDVILLIAIGGVLL